MIHNFRKLRVWQISVELVTEIAETTRTFPKEMRYELTSQILRSAISIPSNIAEGSARTTNLDFSKFLDYALGSAFELETQLIIAENIELIEAGYTEDLIDNLQIVQKMIIKLQVTLK